MSLPSRQAGSNATGIIIIAACLLTIGLVMIASAGATVEPPSADARFWDSAFARQAVFTAAGFVTLLIVSRGGHRFLRWREGSWLQPSVVLFLMTVACLSAALMPGIGAVRHGARRWVQIGPAQFGLAFQPSELAKVALVVLLAALLSKGWRQVRCFWRGLVPACAVIGCCVALVGVEDFGTAALLAGVGGAMLIVGGARLRHLILVGLPGAAALAYLVIREPYRMKRLTVFLDIWSDPQGAGYHPIQSLVTIASGGFTGRGLGAGIQKYGYLPESRSDFILSVICEETGMIGAVGVIALFVALLWLGARVVSARVSPFGRLLAFGVTFLLAFQALINVAVVTVCAPTKGISLPLVSAGGSGVIFLGVAVGLLASVAREAEDEEEVAGVESWRAVPVVQP